MHKLLHNTLIHQVYLHGKYFSTTINIRVTIIIIIIIIIIIRLLGHIAHTKNLSNSSKYTEMMKERLLERLLQEKKQWINYNLVIIIIIIIIIIVTLTLVFCY